MARKDQSVASAASDDSEDAGPKVESWRERDQHVEVTSHPGSWLSLVLRSRIAAAPQDVYSVLTVTGAAALPCRALDHAGQGIMHCHIALWRWRPGPQRAC